MKALRTLVHTWLLLDFFGDSRRTGQPGSTLTTTVFTQSFLSLVLAALLFPETPPVPYATACLCLSTLFVGMGAAGDTDREARREADRHTVATAPVPAGTLLAARILHSGFSVCTVTAGMALPPAILLAFHPSTTAWVIPGYVVLACLLSGCATGAMALVLRAVRAFQGTSRAQLLAGSLKAALLGFGLLGFALELGHLRGTVDDLVLGPLEAYLLPPYQAARVLLAPGASLPFAAALAGLVLVLLVAGWLVPEGERRRATRHGRPGPLGRLERRWARGGPLHGATAFVAAMLYRSPGYRARVLPLFGMPLAMLYVAFQDRDPRGFAILVGIALQFPALYLPFLVAFLPRADQEGTGWIFDVAPHGGLALAREASLLALTTRVLLPLHAIGLPVILLAGFPLLAAVNLSMFSAGAAVLVAVLHLRSLDAMPFTLGSDDETALEFGGLVASALILAALGGAFATAAHRPWALAAGPLVLALALVRLHRAPVHARNA